MSDSRDFLANYRNAFPGATGTLVGKGPSLLHLRGGDLCPGPVITINEAIRLVEPLLEPGSPLFSFQKDGCGSRQAGHDCHDPANPRPLSMVRPAWATLIVHYGEGAGYCSELCFADYSPRFLVDAAMLGLNRAQISAVIGIAMLRAMGCRRIVLVSFDACTCGDLGTAVGEGVGVEYLGQCREMRQFIDADMEWLQPLPNQPPRRFSSDLVST